MLQYEIRPARPSDAEGLGALRRMPGVFENILGIPSEPVSCSEQFLANAGPDTHSFVAVTVGPAGEELIIGSASLTVFSKPRLRHSAGIGIMVHREYQNLGIGTRLMEALLDLADNWLMLTRLELTVFCDNARAIHLYEKMGFVKERIRRKAAIRSGELADEWAMARILE